MYALTGKPQWHGSCVWNHSLIHSFTAPYTIDINCWVHVVFRCPLLPDHQSKTQRHPIYICRGLKVSKDLLWSYRAAQTTTFFVPDCGHIDMRVHKTHLRTETRVDFVLMQISDLNQDFHRELSVTSHMQHVFAPSFTRLHSPPLTRQKQTQRIFSSEQRVDTLLGCFWNSDVVHCSSNRPYVRHLIKGSYTELQSESGVILDAYVL